MPCSACTWTTNPNTKCVAGTFLATCGIAGRSSKPVGRVEIDLITTKRRLVQGTDGGHKDDFCAFQDLPAANCHQFTSFDGLQLRADLSVPWVASDSLPISYASIGSVDGPYQKKGGGKWEWKEGLSEWTYRRYPLVQVAFENVNGNGAFQDAQFIVNWEEADFWDPDIYTWDSPIPRYLRQCLDSGPPAVRRTIATNEVVSNTAGRLLCENRSCSRGEYEVVYDVECAWYTY